jgi:antitoxin HicB
MIAYLVTLTPDDNDTFLVTCPDLPEVTTFGTTEEEIRHAALGAIEEAIAARIAHGEDLPLPTQTTGKAPRNGMFIKMPTMAALKLRLYTILREDRTTRAQLARKLH